MLVGGRRRGVVPRRRPVGGRAPAAVLVVFALSTALAPAGDDADALSGPAFVVDSTGDEGDATNGDGICRTAGPATCTLRAAIEEANASAGHDRIEFAISGSGPHRIEPATALPIISDPAGLTIDGYTQAGAVANTAAHGSNAVIEIELRGTGPSGLDGLYLRSANNVLRGLALFDFRRTIYLHGTETTGNEIVGNYIGTDAAGTFGQQVRVINSTGVHLERGASGNRVGMAGPGNRNVISGNGDRGVGIFDAGTDANTIRNNVIGLAPAGDRLRNWGHGIDINFNASYNIVGGSAFGDRNVLSGNELSGVEISHDRLGGSTVGNAVIGNLIGTDITGASGTAATRNHEFGVNLEGKSSCPTVASCSPDINNNVVEANTIVGSAAGVMIWKGAHDNTVRANRIGVLVNGTIAASAVDTLWGVLIEAGAFDNVVELNTIAGGGDGIQVRPDNDYTNLSSNPDIPTYGNTLRRNSISSVLGFGIDIAPISTVNDASVSDPALQGAIVAPTILTATEDRVVVSTCGNCLVELFVAVPTGSASNVPGRTFVIDGRASAAGVASLVVRASENDPVPFSAGERVTATTTDGAGNTSEFAAWRTAAAGALDHPARALAPATRCGVRC
ncbi:MAG: CSLREA domain-containing protein [Ilumatobacter sp.]|nr:CSLREA domain-containing protein [Ilumatobacter sp.]